MKSFGLEGCFTFFLYTAIFKCLITKQNDALLWSNLKILLSSIGVFKATWMIARRNSCMVSSCLLNNSEAFQKYCRPRWSGELTHDYPMLTVQWYDHQSSVPHSTSMWSWYVTGCPHCLGEEKLPHSSHRKEPEYKLWMELRAMRRNRERE